MIIGTSLAVQWLRLSAGDLGSVPGLGTKIPHAARCSQKAKKNKNKNPDDHLIVIHLLFGK